MYLRKRRLLARLLCWVAIFSWMGCETKTVFHSYQSIPAKGWSRNDTLSFTFPARDSLLAYRLRIEVRNDERYPFQELFLFVRRPNTKDTTLYVTDTVRCLLSDNEGNWKGKGLGAIYLSVHPYADLSLNADSCKISISHGMEDAIIQGINDVGLEIVKQ